MSKSIKPPHYMKYKSNTMFLGKDEFDELFSMNKIMDSMETEINKVRKLKTLFIVPFNLFYISVLKYS